ncbi:MAG: phosphotransferase [Pseudomonadota bacterium]
MQNSFSTHDFLSNESTNPDFNGPMISDASVQEALKNYTALCNIEKISCFKSHSANTNKVFLIFPEEEKESFVLRVSGEQKHGMINSNERLNHIQIETQLLKFLNNSGFPFVPQVLLNDSGGLVSSEKYVAFSYMPGKQIGSFNNLSNFNTLRRADFFRRIGEVSKVLSQYSFVQTSSEKTLTELNNETLERLNNIINLFKESPSLLGNKLISPYIGQLREFGASLNLNPKLLSLTNPQMCHFDLHLGNALFDQDKFTALLDWDWCRLGEWYGVDWVSAIAMCCYTYDPNGGELDGVYDALQIADALSYLRQGFGETGRLPLNNERELLIDTFRSYVFAQFLFTCDHYLEDSSDHSKFIDMRHFLYLIIKNDFNQLIFT